MSEAGTTNDRLVTVATFQEPMGSNVARMALEAAGIAVFVRGENANSMIPVAFETQIQVRAEDEEAAREVLAGAEVAPASEEDVTAAEIAAEQAGQ